MMKITYIGARYTKKEMALPVMIKKNDIIKKQILVLLLNDGLLA